MTEEKKKKDKIECDSERKGLRRRLHGVLEEYLPYL